MTALSLARIDLAALPVADRAQAAEHAAHATAQLAGTRAVVLHTCERFEVYTSGGYDAGALLAESGFAAVDVSHGSAVFRHLLRVASGLESRIPGEPHVLGQVRHALAAAAATVTPELSRAFATALRCARQVRDRSALGAREGGYAARAVATVMRTFPTGGAHVVVVGSGAMARNVARGLDDAAIGRLTIAGRHGPSVELIARSVQARGVALDRFVEGHVTCDAVVTAVSSRQPLVTPATLRAMGARLVVDLGAVPNVAPEVPGRAIPAMVRLDDLATGDRSHAFEVAERLVEREVTRYAAVLRAQCAHRSPTRKAS